MKLYYSDQAFSLWDFNISHQILLLRSNGFGHEKFKNIDVIFWNVSFVNIPTCMNGIEIFELQSGDYHKYELPFSKMLSTDSLFIIKSEEKEYIIGADLLNVYYNELNFSTSSIRIQKGEGVLIFSSRNDLTK
jgi:hypothetical protein